METQRKDDPGVVVWTEAINCGPIAAKALESYLKYHHRPVYVVGTNDDFAAIGDVMKDDRIRLINVTGETELLNACREGHKGTAMVFGAMLHISAGYEKKFIHFDSDIIFQQESLSLIINEFDAGFDLVGSRRCFGNNPSGVKGLEGYPDTISTYFMGINMKKMPFYSIDIFIKMCQGVFSPLNFPILDFFDPVSHSLINAGGNVKFLDQDQVGGQNAEGSKLSKYKSNLHFDFGSHLIHFGGVGSGYAHEGGLNGGEASYTDWALYRFLFYRSLFRYETEITKNNNSGKPTQYTPDGRWCGGRHDESIKLQLMKDMGFGSPEHYRFVADQADGLVHRFNELTKDSTVVDLGGYYGDWSAEIYARYKPFIIIVEPVSEFYEFIKERFSAIEFAGIRAFHCGISNVEGSAKIAKTGDSSSFICSDPEDYEIVPVHKMSYLMGPNEGIALAKEIDVLKINIEGGEYAVLQNMIDENLIPRVKNILVQFHKNVEGYEPWRAHIISRLLATHDRIWNYDYVWECWQRKDQK